MQRKHVVFHYQKLLIICFVALACAAISLTSLTFYLSDAKQNLISKSIFQKNELESAINDSENMFGTATSLMNQFFQNNLDEIISFFVEKNQNPQAKLNLINDLYNTQSNFLKEGLSISFLDLDSGIFYTPIGIMSAEDVFLANDFDLKLMDQILAITYSSDPLYLVSDTEQMMVLRPWSNSTQNNKLIEIYIFNLSKIKIPKYNFEDCSLFISENSNQLFYLGNEEDVSLADVLKQDKLNIKTIESIYFDIEYTIAYPQRDDSLIYSSIFYKYIMPTLILLITASLIMLLFTILYRPIRHLYSSCLDISGDRSDGNEIEMVSNTLSDMHDTIEELQERESSNSELLRKKRIKDLLLGLCNLNEIDGLSSSLNLPLLKGHGSIIIIDRVESDDQSVFETAKKSELIYSLLEKNSKKLDCQQLDCAIQLFSLNRICIMSAIVDERVLSRVVRCLKNKIESCIEEEIMLAICILKENETIPEAYDRVINIINSNHQKYNIMIDRDESTVNDLIYSLETERQLMLVLQEGDFKAIEALSIHIINQNLKSNVPKSRIAQALYITSLRVIQESKIEKDYESYFIFGDDVSDDEFQSRCVTNFLDLSSRLIEQRTEESADLSSEVIAFIEDNYDKDISLTDVADHFHFSMVYMSKLFKKIVGINFKEYLTSIRVERAKQLLIQDWKVQDVALKVGFNNADSFIRMFKIATDISPGKFQSNSKR